MGPRIGKYAVSGSRGGVVHLGGRVVRCLNRGLHVHRYEPPLPDSRIQSIYKYTVLTPVVLVKMRFDGPGGSSRILSVRDFSGTSETIHSRSQTPGEDHVLIPRRVCTTGVPGERVFLVLVFRGLSGPRRKCTGPLRPLFGSDPGGSGVDRNRGRG